MLLPFARWTFLAMALVVGARCQNINQLFTVDQSCNNYPMNQVLTDTRTLITSAMAAINNLKNSNTFLTSTTRSYMRNAANTFGTQYYSKTTVSGLTNNDRNTLSEVSANYVAVQALLSGNSVNGQQLTAASAYLTCADTYVTTTRARDIDPNQPDVDTNTAYARQYLWVNPGHPNAAGRESIVQAPTGSSILSVGPICRQGILGQTQVPQIFLDGNEPLTQIVLCPDLFNAAQQWLQSLNVQPPSRSEKYLYKFLAGALLHELFHVLGSDFSDRTFYPTVGGGGAVQVYGAQLAYAVSHNLQNYNTNFGQVSTLDQPDAYRLFAEECQFPGTKWTVDQQGL